MQIDHYKQIEKLENAQRKAESKIKDLENEKKEYKAALEMQKKATVGVDTSKDQTVIYYPFPLLP